MTTDSQFKTCPFCAEEILPVAIKCKHCGEHLNSPSLGIQSASQPNDEIAKIANLEKIYCYIGISLATIAVFTGIWTILGVIWLVLLTHRLKNRIPRIKSGDKTIPKEYESLFSIIFFTVLFICVSAILLLPMQAVEFIIRDKILKNRNLFINDYQNNNIETGENNE